MVPKYRFSIFVSETLHRNFTKGEVKQIYPKSQVNRKNFAKNNLPVNIIHVNYF